jgi:hypothetical protein
MSKAEKGNERRDNQLEASKKEEGNKNKSTPVFKNQNTHPHPRARRKELLLPM